VVHDEIKNEMTPPTRALRLCWMAAVIFALCAQGLQIWKCATSPMFHFPDIFRDSDMFSTKAWAESILEQGWINPEPFHPQTTWMTKIGSPAEWEAWWGGRQTFQQSPLYAYLFAAFLTVSNDLIYLHLFQGACAVLLFALIGRITIHVTHNQWAGLAAFVIAAAYAPFYVYSWTLVRDLLSWTITAGLIVLLFEVHSALKASRRVLGFAITIGLCLGLGLLMREVYALLIPVVWGATFLIFRRHGRIGTWMVLVFTTLMTLAPLAVRNVAAGAPLLSTSNRFAEAFILGNSGSTNVYLFVIPRDTRAILEQSAGKPWPVVKATLATHRSIVNWMALQVFKFLSLMDPFEPPDNMSFPFMERFSPFVKWGIKHWMIITPGLIGLLISLFRKDTRHWPLWIALPAFIGAIFVAIPLSRYRQAFAVLWIPWAVYFAYHLIQHARQQEWRRTAVLALCLAIGWALSLGPLSRCPLKYRERPTEYELAVYVYQKLNRPEEAKGMWAILQEVNRRRQALPSETK
jgi:4-amino-4-deoxy-L-arabinose transferase-like glycosyltransferase